MLLSNGLEDLANHPTLIKVPTSMCLCVEDKSRPLSINRNHPKFHRLFRTIVNPGGALYRIKFGQFDGKIEVRSQHMLIAIDLCCLLTFNFSSNLAKFDAVKGSNQTLKCSEESVKFWMVFDNAKWLDLY